MAFTWADVVIRAPETAVVSAPAQAQILADVADEIQAARWGSQQRADRAAQNLAAHLAHTGGYITAGAGPLPAGPVTSEAAGPISTSYAAPSGAGSVPPQYASTRYGVEYYRLLMGMVADRVGLVA